MKFYFTLLLICSVFFLSAQSALDNILPEKERSAIIDDILEDRMDNLLPELMDRTGIDMWIIISREYNEDPVMKTMLPSTWLSARRRTIMVFNKTSDGLDKIAIARYSVGKLLKGEWNVDVYPDQWEALMTIIKEKNPKNIGLNYSTDFALADGLVRTEYDEFMNKLPAEYHDRVVSAEKLAIAWLETRSEKELEIYPSICAMGHAIIQEAFSSNVITPGKTTTEDIIWWMRNRVTELGLETWFHPSVAIQRSDMANNEFLRSFSKRPEGDVVQKGDLLHTDFGLTYLRLNTDQQQHFYVLNDGETEVPDGLKAAFKNGNALQDILTDQYTSGKSGNQILKDALAEAKNIGLKGSIYTHPIGFHGHAAGPTIGMWDNQGDTPGRGDYIMYPSTAYSIELFAASEVPEWGKLVRIMLEEAGFYGEDGFRYVNGRQTELLLIPRLKEYQGH